MLYNLLYMTSLLLILKHKMSSIGITKKSQNFFKTLLFILIFKTKKYSKVSIYFHKELLSNILVPKMGLEPTHLSAYAPQAYVSTNSTTWA